MYWKEKTPGMFGADRFPCLRYVQVIDKKHNLYGTPADEYPGMFKVFLVRLNWWLVRVTLVIAFGFVP